MRGRALGASVPAQALGLLFVSGAGLGGLSLLLPHDERAVEWIAWTLAGVATSLGLLMLLRPRWFATAARLHALTAAGTVILTMGVTAAGPGVYGVIYFWTGIYACVFFRWRAALPHVALCGVGYAAALGLADFANDTRLGRWFVTMGALVVLGLVAAWLVGRLAEQQARIGRHAGALRRAESRTRQILETAHDGHLTLDPDGVVLEVNEAAQRLVGRTRRELVGRPIAVTLAPAEAAKHAARREQLLAGGGRVRFETELLHADGSPVPVEISAAVIEVEGERLIAGFVHPLRERRIAEALQRSLLPERLPQLAGVHLAAHYEPAANEADVGGDWYDAMTLPGNRLVLAMGDVAGKGLRGAAMVGRLRSALRAYALEHEDPGLVAGRMNRLVASETDEVELITLVVVLLDPSTGRVRWVNAGHPPPLVVPREGEPWWLEGTPCVPIGAVAAPRYEASETQLPAAATLVLYTDGLVERPGASLDDGFARLAREAAATRADVTEMVSAIVAGGLSAGGGHDDVAVLAMRAEPLGPRLELDVPATAGALAPTRATVRRWLGEQRGLATEDAAQVLLAVDEACTNAVEHARGTGSGTFHLVADATGGELEIAVRSAGAWRPARVTATAEGGRGLTLMASLMDAVDVQTADDATTVLLRRRF